MYKYVRIIYSILYIGVDVHLIKASKSQILGDRQSQYSRTTALYQRENLTCL